MSRHRTTPLEIEADDSGDSGHEFAAELLAQWSEDDQGLFQELLEDATSELQREMIYRGLGASRSAAELHSFADAIRELSDEDVFRECTPPRSGHPLNVLLSAQADPLAAFELNGNVLRSSKAAKKKSESIARLPPALMVDRAVAPVLPRGARAFEAQADTVARRRDSRDLGVSDSPPTTVTKKGPVETRFGEELFNAAGKVLEVQLTEYSVDDGGPGSITVEKALPSIIEALSSGVPVPCVIGNKPGDFRRYALILQLQTSGKNRAYQLYDPAAQELVWANEGDLLNRTELPFADKIFRRLTAILLPRPAPTARPRPRDSSFED